MIMFCRCRLDLCRCLHLSRDLYRPPQATLRNTLLLCNIEDSGKEWHHLAPLLACVCGLVLSSKHAFMSLDLWGSLACTVSVGVMDACDITTASLMAWLMCALLLVWIISPVCVNICESTDLCRGLFLFLCLCVCRSRPSAEPACAYCCYPFYLGLSVVIGALSTHCYCDWLLWKGSRPQQMGL